MSNLKQIGLATMQYVQDYDGKYFARTYGSATPGSLTFGNAATTGVWAPWATKPWFLESYVKSTQLFTCPSFEGFYPNNNPPIKVGYSYNLMAGYPNSYYAAGTPVLSESAIENASQMVAFIDSSFGPDAYPPSSSWDANFCRVPQDNCSDNPVTDKRFGRHLDGVNVSYMDGHAKWQKVNVLWNNGVNTTMWDGR